MKKLRKTEGCTAWGFDYIEDKDIQDVEDLNVNKLKELANKVFPMINTKEQLREFLMWATEEIGEYDCDNIPCECCGDVVTTWTLDLEDYG